jgi:hypothetical protein
MLSRLHPGSSLRAQRSNPDSGVRKAGLLRRFAPRNDERAMRGGWLAKILAEVERFERLCPGARLL